MMIFAEDVTTWKTSVIACDRHNIHVIRCALAHLMSRARRTCLA